MAATENIWKFLLDIDLSGYVLIIPSVAVGNVGQLACDLLISSLHMNKIASLYSPAIIPLIGHDPYDLNSMKLSTSCELFACESRKTAVLQIRSPILFKHAHDFFKDLILKFKTKNVKDIIILTSSFAHENKHILNSPFRYVANDLCSYKDKMHMLNWLKHELFDSKLKIFGGGFASLVFQICNENLMSCLVFFKYCSEGDNIPDAYDMIYQLAKILPILNEEKDLTEQIVKPVSWKLLFGNPPPVDIY